MTQPARRQSIAEEPRPVQGSAEPPRPTHDRHGWVSGLTSASTAQDIVRAFIKWAAASHLGGTALPAHSLRDLYHEVWRLGWPGYEPFAKEFAKLAPRSRVSTGLGGELVTVYHLPLSGTDQLPPSIRRIA